MGDHSKESWTGGNLVRLVPARRAAHTGDGWLHIVACTALGGGGWHGPWGAAESLGFACTLSSL